MTSSFADIYGILLGKIKDFDFVQMDQSDFEYLMEEKSRSVFATPRFRAKFNKFSVDKEIQTITYELVNSVDDDYDKYFVEEVISEGLLIQWLLPYVNNEALLSQFIGTSKEKLYSQANHLSQLEARLHQAELSFDRILTDHGYWNSPYYGTNS